MRSSLGVFVSQTGQTTDRMCNKTEDKQMTSGRINRGAFCDVFLTLPIDRGVLFGLAVAIETLQCHSNRVDGLSLTGEAVHFLIDMVSTFIIPRVGDKPVVLASFCAPIEDLHGVTAQFRAADVMIHAAGVGREVLVHSERTSD